MYEHRHRHDRPRRHPHARRAGPRRDRPCDRVGGIDNNRGAPACSPARRLARPTRGWRLLDDTPTGARGRLPADTIARRAPALAPRPVSRRRPASCASSANASRDCPLPGAAVPDTSSASLYLLPA